MRITYLILLGFIVVCAVVAIECCRPAAAVQPASNDYTGSNACAGCHNVEHSEWSGSHHFMAMQPAKDSFVLGDFNNAVFTADGVTSRFFKKDGKYFIHTEGPDGKYEDYEVKYTFGFEPLQQYLIEFPGGRMQATRVSWDSKAKKWFHQYAGQRIAPGDWLHWTGNGQNWNTMCASCHSTNVKKMYDHNQDVYATQFNELTVGCESCHGPGKAHIDYIQSDAYENGSKTAGSLLKLYHGANRMSEINTCGYCHARRTDLAEASLGSEDVLEQYIPALAHTEFFHADGQMRDEDYNYSSFLQSKMFQRGVQCTNCHNPHSGRLKANGSLVCSQCHQPEKYQSPTHTMHASTLADVNCVSCHMPSAIYMGNDLRHDHSFRIPRPDLSAKYGTPNTCNACHSSESPQWAAAAIEQHFGKKPDYHFSEDLIPGSIHDSSSQKHLSKLMADSAVPNLIRATAVYYASMHLQQNNQQAFWKYLTDTSTLVRYTSARHLRPFSVPDALTHWMPLLKDPVNIIQTAAANALLDLPDQQIPADAYNQYQQARQALERYILFQADFAAGSAQAGDFYLRMGNLEAASKFYERALAKDSQMVAAMINYATLLNRQGNNEKALPLLQAASRLEPNSDHVQYSLALLLVEMTKYDAALLAFKKCTALNPRNVRAFYNYGLLLQQMGKATEAEKQFMQALKIEPYHGEVLYALVLHYLNSKQTTKALGYANLLKKHHPTNPDYQALYSRLGLP